MPAVNPKIVLAPHSPVWYICDLSGWSVLRMNALLKTMQRVANDWRGPQKPRILSVVTVGRTPHGFRPLTAIALAVLISALLVAAGGTAWFVHELDSANPGILAPALLATGQPVAPKVNAVTEHPHPAATHAPDDLADITLPASQLETEGKPADPAITIIATKLADLPVLREPGHAAIALSPASDASTDSLLDQAHADLQSGDTETAYALYEQVLAADPANHDALAAEAYLLAQSGDYAGAAKIDRRVLKYYPRDAAARRSLIAALSHSVSPEAEEELDSMASAMPNDAAVQAALARKLIADGDTEAALPPLDRAVRAAPSELPYRLELAALYDRLGKPAQALSLYRDILRAAADPDAPVRLPVSLTGIRQRAAYLEAQMGVGNADK